MKKLLTVIFLLHHFSGWAQIALGVRLGVNAFNPTFNPVLVGEPKMVYSYEAGLAFQHIADPHLGIQLEAIYSQTSWQQDFDSTNYFRQNLRNIDISFLTHIYLGKQHKGVFINIGPTASFTISSAYKEQVDTLLYKYHLNRRSISRFQLGLTGGLGYIVNIGSGALQLEARFTQRLTNLLANEESNRDFRSSHPMLLSASLSYFFRFGRNKPLPKQGVVKPITDK